MSVQGEEEGRLSTMSSIGHETRRGKAETAEAIRLKHVLLVCWRRSPVYYLVLVGVISFTTCPISTCSAKPLMDQQKRSPVIMVNRQHWGKYEPSAESAAYDDELQTYLTEFGYLPKNNPEISNLRSDVAVKSALARLQEYGGLNVTSKLDEPTRKLMKSKRCGMADTPYDGGGNDGRLARRFKRYQLFGGKWTKLRLTYKVVNYSPHMDQGQTRRGVYDALKLWSDASALEFVETMDNEADLLIEFHRGDHGDGYPFDGRHFILAHAFFPGTGRGGDAHFDADEIWTHMPIGRENWDNVNFFTVAAHEFGHSLGLGHSKDRNALMYAYYKDLSHIKTLPYDDAMGIQKIYGIGKYGVPEVQLTTTSEPTTPRRTHLPNPTYQQPSALTTPVPDACHSHIDAVSRIRNEVFVFKGLFFWRYDDDGGIVADPTEIKRFWHGFPDDFDGVDAVFERTGKNTIVFFKGNQYWEFRDNYVLPGYPRDITSIGMPKDVKEIDAAFVWDWNKKAYLFAGKRYWRLNEADLSVDHDYPRLLGETFWKDVPFDLDAAFTDKLGVTYFFKDSNVYKFNNHFSRVRDHPVKISEFWPQCKPKHDQLIRDSSSASKASVSAVQFFIIALLSLIHGRSAL